MKKKIILFLSVLLAIMFLTGCSTTIDAEALEKSNNIAKEVASNMGEYKLPDGYSISYPDSKDTSRFELTSKPKYENTLTAEYKISNKEAELVSFEIDDNNNFIYSWIFLMIFVLGICVGKATN